MNYNAFSKEMIDYLKYYVYLYIDPSNNEVFYVGKGKGNRVFDHLKSDNQDYDKIIRINTIKESGNEPKIELLVHGLEDEETAKKVEAAAIDLIGINHLTNLVRGYKTCLYGRISIEEFIQRYNTESVKIEDPSVLIRINELFYYGMSAVELYDATRSSWKLNKDRAQQAKYAFAVYDGVVQEVYTILNWLQGGTSFSIYKNTPSKDRFEFVGNIAPEGIRKKYLNKSVKDYFEKGSQNPIMYANI